RNGTGAHAAIEAEPSADPLVKDRAALVEAPASGVPIKQAPIGEAPTLGAAKPTLGLALGGGAARGFAHIGVLRALMARGLKFDVIAGTSIGAVVGGTYAAGQLDPFEEWARGLTRRRVFGYLDFSMVGSGLIGG